MENKTCGQCKYHDRERCNLPPNGIIILSETEACRHFRPKTNGDVIRQDWNRDFAEYFVYETGAVFASTLIVDKTFDTYDEAVDATMEYLNAPAEEGGEDE